MAHLYVTTDVMEAGALIEGMDRKKNKHVYHDLELTDGALLEKRVGFNPMCSVEVNGNSSVEGLNSIVAKLVKEGLYVATDIDGQIRMHMPHDSRIREELVKISLQGDGRERALRYSNNPHEIRNY